MEICFFFHQSDNVKNRFVKKFACGVFQVLAWCGRILHNGYRKGGTCRYDEKNYYHLKLTRDDIFSSLRLFEWFYVTGSAIDWTHSCSRGSVFWTIYHTHWFCNDFNFKQYGVEFWLTKLNQQIGVYVHFNRTFSCKLQLNSCNTKLWEICKG